MLKVWAILLFGGLLTLSQGLDGTVQVLSSVDVNGLEKVIADVLHRGDILNSVQGTMSAADGGLLNLAIGLTGLEIKKLTLPKVSLKLLPGVGVQMNVYTQVLIEGKGLLGKVLSLQVDVNITARARLAQDDMGAPKLIVEDCKTQLVNVRILHNVLPLHPTVLKDALGNLFPGVLCPLIDTVLNAVNPLLSTVNSVVPLGVVGNLQYTLASLPVVSDAAIKLDLNAVVKDLLGNKVDDPTCSAATVSLPSEVDSSSQLGLSLCLLSSVLKLLLAPGKLSTDIAGQTLPTDIPLTASALRTLVPEVSELLPESQQPLLKIRVLERPAVSEQNGNVTVRLPASIEVSPSDSPQQPLFVLDADIVLSVQPTISDNKLRFSVTLERVGFRLASSLISDFNVALLEPLISDILSAAYVPLINDALKVGIPLPNLLNLNWENGLVKVMNNVLLVNALA
ncbi:BPI fold-containing family B member 3-like [Chelonia mydas]|uniref:BPI fold-containing family B member 3-like n=1 Tax=Chelonia mydas TaxID=8469 RepID=UPI0018A22420|nr:BPI fold-containing family B member 3-like [Chelonia mydas]XP_037771821.1 BPI fold-containing family B member 3-like [Chelonia mydas]XP_043382923.1 BPI fold-containing family B member 3-like [Chelonia mydas]